MSPSPRSQPGHVTATVDLDGPGRSVGHLLVPGADDDHAYSTIPVPLAVVAGHDGPTALLVAGTHGDEWEGQLIVRNLLRSLDPDRLHGRLVLLPAFNLPAVRAARRCSPIDGENMNRAFPGDPEAGPTRMLAHYVESTVLPRCDYAMDLHSGGSASDYLPCAFLRIDDDRRRTEEKVTAATVLGLPHAFVVPAAGEARTLSAAADRQGTIMVATELGGGGRVDAGILAQATTAVHRLLVHWGLLAGDGGLAWDPASTDDRGTRFLRLGGSSAAVVTTAGLLEPLVRLGDRVDEGTTIARVHPLEYPDRPPEEVRAPVDGVVAIVRTPPRVQAGDVAASIGVPVEASAIVASSGNAVVPES